MNDELTPDVLKEMVGLNKVTPTQASAALGHSNLQLGGFLKGMAKSAVATLQSGNVLDSMKGMVGEPQLKDITGVDPNQAVKPQNQSEQVGDIIGTGAQILAPMVGMREGIANAGNKILEKTGIKALLGNRGTSKAIEKVSSTAETMTKGERLDAIKQGRMQPTLSGGGKYVPSETEQNAGKLLQGKLTSNPVKNVAIVKKEISTQGKAAETYLEQNVQKISNEEDFNAFNAKRTDMAKYSTDSEMKAYNEQIDMFQKQLQDRGEYNTANYYKALKDYETNVSSKLAKGKDALLDPTGTASAKLQAAKDVRSVVRDMIGQKNPEFKQKMYDLASLYDAQDNVVSKAESVGTFGKRHPVLKKTATYGAEAIGAGLLYEGAKDVGAPLP